MNRRLTLGLISIVLLATGITFLIVQPRGQEGRAFAAACIRVGLATSAVWLAYRDLQKVPVWMFAGIFGLILVVAIRPRYILLAIPILVAFWFLRPRSSSAVAQRRENP